MREEKYYEYNIEILGEDALRERIALKLIRKEEKMKNIDFIIYELITITLENINLSIENFIIEDLCEYLRDITQYSHN